MPHGEQTITKGPSCSFKTEWEKPQRTLKLHKSTVLDIWKKYEKSGNTNNKQLKTSRQNPALVCMSLQDTFLHLWEVIVRPDKVLCCGKVSKKHWTSLLNLVESIPSRLRAVMKARGGHTKF